MVEDSNYSPEAMQFYASKSVEELERLKTTRGIFHDERQLIEQAIKVRRANDSFEREQREKRVRGGQLCIHGAWRSVKSMCPADLVYLQQLIDRRVSGR